ncbi:hypothetical protein MNBD_ALPHA04-2380 [hydrothermal vent metagenome]|uniref:OmpA-like domain-containing protein n=1 Tax=hydrothermal vent metagenome TaxID=652676 RepID=A0A3B0SJK4_9ZZZZ
MEVGGKILTGAAATALLAFVGHYATGDSFIAELESKAKTELTAQGLDGVTVSLGRYPLSRTAVLDGDVSDDVKQNAGKAVQGIAGIAGYMWAGEGPVAAAGSDTGSGTGVDSATQAKVAQCQDGIDKTIEGKKLSFKSGSAYVSPASNKLLDEIAVALKPCSGLAIAVGGHTDDNGDAEVNRILSQERADRVRAGLIERGVSENLVTAKGYGAEQPLAKGGDAAADAQNRRIEFTVQPKGSDAPAQQGE